MKLILPVWILCLILVGESTVFADEVAMTVLPPANERFGSDTTEIPSFQRHVLPLMGRTGCNGRACHGSFQGQGGFRLSLFGYDFKSDHDALTAGDTPRVNPQDVPESLMLLKATLETPHKGGQRIEAGGWEYRLFSRWIESGAIGVKEDDVGFDRLEITPQQIVFTKPGETVRLKVTAVWNDGVREDVTPLCRFRTNDESISEISPDGVVSAVGVGDTHVVAFYDNGVAPAQTLLPVSDRLGPNYPEVATPTRVDELVVQKLRTLGIVPSDLNSDAEFLRRVSLDMTGSLPAPTEIEAFLADTSADKRARKIDELLERPAYAAWWATRLSDTLGNNPVNFLDNNNGTGARSSSLWYSWIENRLRENVPYDKLVEGMLVASSRQPGQSYDDYLAQMAALYRKSEPVDLDQHSSVPFFWERRTFNQPAERSMAVAYAFLGIRLQCAQCHKHPFDQWTQDDFNQFTNFFGRVVYREPADPPSRKLYAELNNALKKDKKDRGRTAIAEGQPYPFREVYVQANGVAPRQGKNKKNKKPQVTRSVTARALGEDPVTLPGDVDPRQMLMDWLRDRGNPYFARAFVNRVWAAYFGVGIIEPADDLNLANPPSNAPLLAYLETEFVARGYDIKWLHREIANSRTYQLSWKTNDTNRLDQRNFSHAIPRRLPAEVAVDAIQMALASSEQLAKWTVDPSGRTITKTDGFVRNRGNADYALGIFGRPARLTNCDCERSTEPSLLQTIYLRNDGEVFRKLNDSQWLRQLDRELNRTLSRAEQSTAKVAVSASGQPAGKPTAPGKDRRKQLRRAMVRTEEQIAKFKASEDLKALAVAEARLTKLKRQLKVLKDAEAKAASATAAARTSDDAGSEAVATNAVDAPAAAGQTSTVAEFDWNALLREAYLRTVSRPPTEEELQRTRQYIMEAERPSAGIRDVVWALLNTKEFIVNH